MSERFWVRPAVDVVAFRPADVREILLIQRANTGFCDGLYDTPGGHLESDETPTEGAARELREETGLIADPSDLELFHIMMNENNPERPYLYMYFKISTLRCLGEIALKEPQKCTDIGMFRLDNLPNPTPHLVRALDFIDEEKVTFSKAL